MFVFSLCFGFILFVIIDIFGGYTSPVKRAGRQGEKFAQNVLSEILTADDYWFVNVKFSVDDRRAELDNVIVNQNGIFIIEVKNLVGELHGEIDSPRWTKYKYTYDTQVYRKVIKNPFKQVHRQVWLFKQYLKKHDIHIWIKGYLFFVERNCPVVSEEVLVTQRDIEKAIHQNEKQLLSKEDVKKVVRALRDLSD